MRSLLDGLDAPSLRIAKIVGTIAGDHGLQSFVIGGCVRDLVLERRVIDLDFSVENDAALIARDFAQQTKGQAVIYKQFLTATVTLPDGKIVDFTTLRKESYPSPGALPVVQKGTVKEDLFRRDFTINAMAVCVNPDGFGDLVDDFEGMKDVRAKKIRILHDQSFRDDPTRILRAVRFEQRFGFKLESKTEKLLKEALKANALKSVKKQRLFDEFKKNLTESNARQNIARLSDLGFFVKTGWGIKSGEEHLKELKQLGRILVWAQKQDCPSVDVGLMRLMIMLDGLASRKVETLLSDWGVSGADREVIRSAQTLRRFFEGGEFKFCSREELFHRLRGQSGEALLFAGLRLPQRSVRSLIAQALTQWRRVSLTMTGEDLKRAGIPSGKIYKDLLEKVLYRVSLGECLRKDEQLAYARTLYQLDEK